MTRTQLIQRVTGIFVGTFLCLGLTSAHGATYYISSSNPAASDTYTAVEAQSEATPWKTIDRVNTALASATPGDVFLFKRGDTFVGGLRMARSGSAGSPIVFDAYGSGAKPIISGFATISSGWSNIGGNIWEIDAPDDVDATSTMVMNGTVMPLARWPRAGATNGGYLMSDSGTSTSISDGALVGAPAFTSDEGTEIVIRTNHWTLTRAPLGSVAGTTLAFPTINSGYTVGSNMGYFLQNSTAFLASSGDWMYNPTTGTIRLYYTGTPPTISFAQVDELVALNGSDYLTFSNLSFQGAKINGMYGNTSSNITVNASEFIYAGQYALRFNYGGNISITDSLISESQNNAILVYSPTLGGITIEDNRIINTGIRPGAIAPRTITDLLHAINVSVDDDATIQSNIIENTGYVGIRFQGNGITVANNVIKRFTTVLDDGGAIYTYNRGGDSVEQWSARTIAHNIISEGVGAGAGTATGATQSYGVYLDLNTNNVTVSNNTIFDVASKAITSNSPHNVTLTGNTVYNTEVGIGFNRLHDGVAGGQDISGITMNGNVVFQTESDQSAIQYVDVDINYPTTSTVDARIASMGSINNNFYRLLNPGAFAVSYRTARGGTLIQNPGRSLAQWKALSGFDQGSTEVLVPTYRINSTVGTTMTTTNTTFDGGVAGVAGFGPLCTYTADATGKLTGSGSLKISVVTPTTSATAHCEASARIGAVSSGKAYVLRFSTIGTTNQGSFRVTLMHKSSSPVVLTPWQKGSFGTGRTEHEFLFTNPATHSTPSWIIDMYAQSGGTLYIDNVEVYEVDASVLSESEGSRFVYNSGANSRNISLNGTYTNVRGGTHTDSITLPAYSSAVLIKSGTTTTPPPTPDTTLPTVSITAPTAGATVSGTAVTLSATANDNVGVTRVDFYRGTTLIGTDTSAPYSVTWTTTGLTNGPYPLTAVARDAAGNTRTSNVVNVSVSNLVTDTTLPTVSLITPNPTTVSGTITLIANATDNIGVTRVEFYKDTDTTAMSTDTSSPYTASVITTQLSNGVHTFRAVAVDAAGNRRTSNTITLTITNTITTPTTPVSGGGGGGGEAEPSPTTPTLTTPTVPVVPITPTVPTIPGCIAGSLYSNLTGARCDGATPSPVTQTTTTATITGRMVNVRTAPITGAVITTMPAGTTGTVLTTSAGWIQVAFGNVTGWVSQNLLALSSPVAPVSPSTSTGPYNFGPVTLTTGSRGEGVKELQRFLNRYLNLGLVVDGILGPKTTAVIRTWQSQQGLVPDGLIGAKTKAMMNQIATQ